MSTQDTVVFKYHPFLCFYLPTLPLLSLPTHTTFTVSTFPHYLYCLYPPTLPLLYLPTHTTFTVSTYPHYLYCIYPLQLITLMNLNPSLPVGSLRNSISYLIMRQSPHWSVTYVYITLYLLSSYSSLWCRLIPHLCFLIMLQWHHWHKDNRF